MYYNCNIIFCLTLKIWYYEKNMIKKYLESFCCLISVLFLISCNHQYNMDDLEEKYMKVSDFAFVGNLHNTVMTKVNDGIPSEKIVSESSTKEEAVDAVATFIDVEMNKCNIKDYSKDLILKYKNFLKTEEFGSVLFSDATRGGEDIADILKKIEDMCDADVIELEDIPSLESMVHALSSKGLLSEKSIYFFENIISLMRRSYQGLLSDAEFERQIMNLVNEFDVSGYKIDSADGACVASVLSVAQSSYSWWKDNPDAVPVEGKVAQWVVVDTGGAVLGGFIYCFKNWNNRVVWSDLGSSCATSAVTGSLGLSAKIGKAIFSLFK